MTVELIIEGGLEGQLTELKVRRVGPETDASEAPSVTFRASLKPSSTPAREGAIGAPEYP